MGLGNLGWENTTHRDWTPSLVAKSKIHNNIQDLVRLGHDNPQYKEIEINHDLLHQWPEIQVPMEVLNSILVEDNQISEKVVWSDDVPILNSKQTPKSCLLNNPSFPPNRNIVQEEEENSLHQAYDNLIVRQQLADIKSTQLSSDAQLSTGSVLSDVENRSGDVSYEPEIIESLCWKSVGHDPQSNIQQQNYSTCPPLTTTKA